jgi:amino acid adenylation domain-containing protein
MGNTRHSIMSQKLFSITKKPDGVHAPLSLAQRRLWFLYQLDPQSPEYNISRAWRLKGPLNTEALVTSLNLILARHETLRTTFQEIDGQPIQVIQPTLTVPFQERDCSSYSPAQLEIEIDRFLIDEPLEPFDLLTGPLLRFNLIRCGPDDHVLIFTVHHMVCDGTSLKNFCQELSCCYAATVAGQPTPLAPLPIQFQDFAYWQQDHVTDEKLASQLAFWNQQLQGAPLVLELPSDCTRPKDSSGPGTYQVFTLAPQVISNLKQLIQPQGITLFMALLVVFQILLTRYTGQRDILVGTPIAGRTHTDLEELIGFLVNTLVLRTQIVGQPTFQEYLRQIRKTCLEAYRHHDLPFDKLVEVLKPVRDPSRYPVVQAIFQLRQLSDLCLTFPKIVAHPFPVKKRTGNFDLHMVCEETGSGIEGFLYYPQDLFSDTMMARFTEHYQLLLEELIANPQRPVTQVPFLTNTECHQQLIDWNDTTTAYPKDASLPDLFAAQVVNTPEAVAVVWGEKQLTYGQLNARANQLARYLRRQGLGPEFRVGVCLERSVDLIVSLLAILKAGGAYVPLDPSYPANRLSYMMEDAGICLLVTTTALQAKLSACSRQVFCVDNDWASIHQESERNLNSGATPENAAYVIYTSGSTGHPKGVLVSHYNVVRLFQSTHDFFHFTAQDVWTLFHSYAFDFSVWEIWGAFSSGGRLVIVPYIVSRSAEEFHEVLLREQVTVLNQTPSSFNQLIQVEDSGGLEHPLALRYINFGAEALAMHDLEPWFTRHGDTCPQLINMYGITETTVHVTAQPLMQTMLSARSVIGRPLADLRVYVLDKYKHLLPIGVLGELYVGGAGLARGYLHRPDLTAERFIPDPFCPHEGARLYRTGDLARYRQDGAMEYLGRIDHQVKLRGFRIELGEIEAVLRQESTVQDVVVLCREDTHNEKQLVSYVVQKQNDSVSVATLRNLLQKKLPEYMVPKTFVVLDTLPLTPSGKIDRRALPAPDSHRETLETVFVPPRNPEEEILAEIWTATLNIPEVGIHDNFFALGGHSLLATKIISKIQSVFSVTLPIRALFEHPSVAGLARQLAERSKHELQEEAPNSLPPYENLPLSFTQERFWVLDQLHGQNQTYYFSRSFRLKGPVNEKALQQSFQAIVNRHEILRTTFPSVDGLPQQVISPTFAFNMSIIELKNLTEATRETAELGLMKEEEARPIDLVQGPLLRVKLVRFDPQDYLFILTTHHVIWDARSTEILFHELSSLYGGYREGREPSLPPLALQYSDFTFRQRNHLEGPVSERELAYWKKTLEDSPPPLALPTDYPRPAMQTFRGGQVDSWLSQEFIDNLLLLKQRSGNTFFTILLAVLQLLLSRYTGTTDILVGAPIAGRNRQEFEPLIGCFLNNLVLRTKFTKVLTFAQLLRQVREQVFGALAHQEIPFEKLLDELHIERNAGRTPLFQVFLNMHNFSDKELSLPGVETTLVVSPTITSLFDWTLYFQEYPDQIHLRLVYKADLFAERRMLETMNQLQSLLEQVVQDPNLPLPKYSLMTKASRDILPDPTLPIDEPSQETVCTLFRRQAQAIPSQSAIRQGSRAWTFHDLLRRTDALAQTLKERRLEPGEVVAIGGPRSFGLVVALLAVLQAGGVIMPLDPRLPGHRQRLMRQEAKAKRYVWIGQGFPQDFITDMEPNIVLHQVDPETGIVLDQQPHVEISSVREYLPQPDDPAYLFFTSGTTGSPKGILGQHKSLSHFLTWQAHTFQVGPQDRIAQLTALSFDAVLRDIFLPLISGASLCLPDDQIELDPTNVIPWINQERITILHAVPTVAQFWLKHVPEKTKLPSLRWTFFSGEPMTDVFVNKWRQTFSESGHLVNFYGPTETTLIKCWYVIPDPPQTGIQPIGFPMPHTQALIVGPDTHLCGIGEVGEIVLRTPFRTLGYINAPSDQQRGFRPNPYLDDPSDLFYWTGDRGRYRLDGSLDILGRMDNQIKIRGVRIEPEEITTILQGHPSLEAAAVLGHAGKEGDNYLVAYVVSKSTISLTEQSIRTFLSSKVPAAMIPSSIVFLDALPYTPNGKLDHRALPVPTVTSQNRTTLFVEPRNPIEEELARIWSEVLRVARVGIYDNFFELGGHSLLAMQVINRIQKTFHVPFPLQQIFASPTLAECGQYIDSVATKKHPSELLRHSSIFQDREEGLI